MSARVPVQQTSVREHYRFTLDKYHQMIATGFLGREDRFELINGELIMTPPIGPGHCAHSASLRERIENRLPKNCALRVAEPITLPPDSEPEPDFAVVRRRADYYLRSHPEPKDILLLIEVSDTSVAFDVGEKALVYALAGIVEYWVLDIVQKRLRVFTEPGSKGYRTQRILETTDTIKCGSVSKLELAVSDMLL